MVVAGVTLHLGPAFQCMVIAAVLMMVVCVTTPMLWKIQTPLQRLKYPYHEDEKSDEDLRQVISSTY